MTKNAIELFELEKKYSGRWGRKVKVLDGISLSVEQGEVFGFIGKNGAGKSTTIKIMTGIVPPTSGGASLWGITVNRPESRLGLGYVPENPYLYDYLTPLEILLMGVRVHGLKIDNPTKHCMNWLDRFGIAGAANRRLRNLSKGMTQRTALAHAMAILPKLLILDEPLSGLDPIGRKDVVDILMEYKQQGGTLFFSSHVLHDVERLADRFCLIEHGEIAAIQRPSELLESQKSTVMISYKCAQPVFDEATQKTWNISLYETERENLWGAIDKIRTLGGEILEVKSSASLEKLFMQIVKTNL